MRNKVGWKMEKVKQERDEGHKKREKTAGM
jgi:hypothetical protein